MYVRNRAVRGGMYKLEPVLTGKETTCSPWGGVEEVCR